MSTKKKPEYFQLRVDPLLKQALQEYCKINFIDESSAIRMAVAQYPLIKKILEDLWENEQE
jgi:hypothetical protein